MYKLSLLLYIKHLILMQHLFWVASRNLILIRNLFVVIVWLTMERNFIILKFNI